MIYHSHELKANPRRSVPQTRAKPAGAAPSPAACAPRVAGSAAAGDSQPCKCAYQRAGNTLHTLQPVSLLLVDYDTTKWQVW